MLNQEELRSIILLSGDQTLTKERTLKDYFYLEMALQRVINDIMQNPQKKMHFFFFSVCCIVFNCSWQLTFDKKEKSSAKRIHLLTDDGLYDGKAFYKVKIVYIHPH